MIINKLLPFFAASVLMLFSGCIQEEPLNAECDITGVDSLWLQENKDMLIGSPIITNTSVSLICKEGSDKTNLAPSFYLTPGAKIVMRKEGIQMEANGVARDFTVPQTYTTISEDGNWSKDYTVSFVPISTISLCSFENSEMDPSGRYHVWFEEDSNGKHYYWGTGNAGYAFTGMGKNGPESFPTFVDSEGYKGKGVTMITRNTGSFGAMAGMPIAAGNIFIGEFKSEMAMREPRNATRFGLQLVSGKPVSLSGYYKYTAGEVFTDKDKKVDETRKDTCDIYAVLYEVDSEKFISLQGDNILNSERIVSMARIDNPGEPKEWTYFEEPFRPMNGKQFDYQRLLNYGYAIAIVATSSRQGAYFEGAVGSILHLDEIQINWENADHAIRY